jgi:hypothetical protein
MHARERDDEQHYDEGDRHRFHGRG